MFARATVAQDASAAQDARGPAAAETRIEPAAYAPAELTEPYVPDGAPVDPDTAEHLSLDDVLAYADAHAPSIASARARVGRVTADRREAGITLPSNPEVSLAAGGRTTAGTTGFEFEVAVEQAFSLGHQRAGRLASVEAREEAARGVVNEVRWAVHVEAHRLYVDLLLAQERLEQAQQFASFSQSLRDVAARQIEAGESSPLTLLVAEADLAATREAVIEATLMRAALRIRLATLIGWPASQTPEMRGRLPSVLRAPDVQTLLLLMAEHHPSLRTRELAVVASQQALAVEERSARPDVTLGASYGREAAPGPAPESHVWMLQMRVPIPSARRNQRGRARAEAELVVADRERDEQAADLASRMLQAAVALNAAAELVEMYETGIVPQFEEHLLMLQRAYELGEVDLHQVSQTRERLLSATDHYIDARVAYYESAAALEGLVGTEFWFDSEHTH